MQFGLSRARALKGFAATEFAFAAAFFFLPLSKPGFYLSLAAAAVLFAADGRLIRAVREWRTLPWTLPALLLAALPLLALLFHENPGPAHPNLTYYWLFAFIVFLASSQMSVRPWLGAFAAGVLVVVVLVEIQSAGWIPVRSLPSGAKNYILYSQLLAIAIVALSVLYGHDAHRRRRIIYLAGMALLFFGLVTGRGRSGIISLVVLFPLVFANLFGMRHPRRVLTACAAAALVVALTPPVQTRLTEAIGDLARWQRNDLHSSLGFRLEMWSAALDVFRAHPLLGAGPAAFEREWKQPERQAIWKDPAAAAEARGFIEPHNAFLFFAASYGIVGLIALLWLYVALLWTGWKNRQRVEGSVVLAFAVILLLGSVTNTMFMGATSRAWIMLFIGLQGGLLRGTSASGAVRSQP